MSTRGLVEAKRGALHSTPLRRSTYEEGRITLHFGTLRPYKQTLELLDRFSATRDGRLIVAGEPWGDYGDEVRAKVAALQLEEYVTLDLRVPRRRRHEGTLLRGR